MASSSQQHEQPQDKTEPGSLLLISNLAAYQQEVFDELRRNYSIFKPFLSGVSGVVNVHYSYKVGGSVPISYNRIAFFNIVLPETYKNLLLLLGVFEEFFEHKISYSFEKALEQHFSEGEELRPTYPIDNPVDILKRMYRALEILQNLTEETPWNRKQLTHDRYHATKKFLQSNTSQHKENLLRWMLNLSMVDSKDPFSDPQTHIANCQRFLSHVNSESFVNSSSIQQIEDLIKEGFFDSAYHLLTWFLHLARNEVENKKEKYEALMQGVIKKRNIHNPQAAVNRFLSPAVAIILLSIEIADLQCFIDVFFLGDVDSDLRLRNYLEDMILTLINDKKNPKREEKLKKVIEVFAQVNQAIKRFCRGNSKPVVRGKPLIEQREGSYTYRATHNEFYGYRMLRVWYKYKGRIIYTEVNARTEIYPVLIYSDEDDECSVRSRFNELKTPSDRIQQCFLNAIAVEDKTTATWLLPYIDEDSLIRYLTDSHLFLAISTQIFQEMFLEKLRGTRALAHHISDIFQVISIPRFPDENKRLNIKEFIFFVKNKAINFEMLTFYLEKALEGEATDVIEDLLSGIKEKITEGTEECSDKMIATLRYCIRILNERYEDFKGFEIVRVLLTECLQKVSAANLTKQALPQRESFALTEALANDVDSTDFVMSNYSQASSSEVGCSNSSVGSPALDSPDRVTSFSTLARYTLLHPAQSTSIVQQPTSSSQPATSPASEAYQLLSMFPAPDTKSLQVSSSADLQSSVTPAEPGGFTKELIDDLPKVPPHELPAVSSPSLQEAPKRKAAKVRCQ
jgi:hypothetical protein